MIELPSLYSHQESQRDACRAALAKHRRVILTAPPGTGKTRMSKWVLGASLSREPSDRQSGRSLFVVHRRGLVQNAIDSFGEDPYLPHGVIMSGEKTAYGHRIQVASIDSLLSWFVDGGKYDTELTFDLIVWDEAHSHHPKFARFLKHHDAKRKELGLHPAFVIGLTATPQAKGLADVYKEIVQGPSTEWLISEGYLSPFRYFRATQGQLGLLVKHGNEFTKDSEAKAMEGLAGDLVRDWKKYAEGRPTVGFFPRRSHAQEAMERLQEAGLRVAYVDGETSDDSRKRIFWELNEHRIDYLCNVQVVERGTDIPRIGCVQLCVAVGSLVRFRQMIGRGSRVHPAKKDCCVARDTMILTDRGEVPIQEIRLTDRIWDGIEFCSHDGPVCNGKKEVMEWSGGPYPILTNGITLTPDHKVLTNDGWKEAEAAKAGGWRCVSGAAGGVAVRTADDSNPYNPGKWPHARGRGGLLSLWKTWMASLPPHLSTGTARLRALYSKVRTAMPGVGLETGSTPKAEMPVSSERSVPTLRRARDRVQILFNLRGCLLGRRKPRASTEQVMDYRPDRQRRPLRAGESALGNLEDPISKSRVRLEGEIAAGLSFRDLLRWPTTQSPEAGIDSKENCRPMVAEVWDIRNVGPRNRYCANGMIVANCILDHGGNVLRHGFFEDDPQWTLDITTKDPGECGARPTIECPNCSAIYRGGKCRNCGYEPTPKERKKQGLDFDGSELVEVKKTEKKKSVKSAEDLMVSCLFRAGRSGRTWKQAVGMFYRESEKQGTRYRVPKKVEIAGCDYEMIRYGDSDGGRRVEDLFPVTNRGGHGGNYLVQPQLASTQKG